HSTIVLVHELLYRKIFAVVLIAEELGEFALVIEQQALFRPLGHHVQTVAHSPQIFFTAVKQGKFFFIEKMFAVQLTQCAYLIVALGYPADDLNIADAAGGIFDIGFEIVFRVIVFLVPLNLLIPFCAKKFIRGPELIRGGELLQLRTKPLIANQRARLHDIGSYGNVGACSLHTLFNRSDAVTDLQSDVSQQGKKALDIILAHAQRVTSVEVEHDDAGEQLQLTVPI